MSIVKYEDDGHTFWRVYVHARSKSNRGKRIQRYRYKILTEAEARREEKKLTREVLREVHLLDGMGLYWEDVVHLWREEVKQGYIRKLTIRSAEGYFSIINKWTTDWNEDPAAELTRADGRKLLQLLEREGISYTYQKKIRNIINSIFEWGIEFGHIIGVKKSPMAGLLISKGEEKVPDILTREEIKKFLTAAKLTDHLWYPTWSFAILTGMRSGELHALTWDQIDLDKKTILVNKSYDSNSKEAGPTKGRYWRVIPINESLEKLILDLRVVFKRANEEHVLPRCSDWDNGDQACSLKNFLRSIKIRPIKFHALRACFATQMLASGVPSPVVMKIGGWKKSSTMDIYLRLAGVDTKGATDCLQFVPDDISFTDNVVNIFEKKS